MAQEDFCILQPSLMGRYELTAACVCFPGRWDLPSKIGKSLSLIHQPVPGFEEKLAKAVNRLFFNISCERPVWRQNWAIDTDPELHQPTGHGEQIAFDLTPANAGNHLWLPTEYQTISRLPETRAIIFSIRNLIWPLTEVDNKEDRLRLATHLKTMASAMSDYKSITGFKEALIAWLERNEG